MYYPTCQLYQSCHIPLSQSVTQQQCLVQTTQPDINGAIINEREQLRMQLMELEDRYHIDIEELKVNLLSESERILQKSLNELVQQYEPQIHQKDSQINVLTQKLHAAETTLQQVQAENSKLKEIVFKKKDKIKYYKQEMENQNNFHIQKLNEQEQFWRERLNKELNQQKLLFLQEFQFEKKSLEDQIYKLKSQLAQFDEKYQQILFELEKIKQQLQEKTHECEEWKTKCRRLEHIESIKPQTLQHSPSRDRVLEAKIEQLEREIRVKDAKLAKKKEKVQTVIQHVPQQVIVEKPIERIIEIEKIVPVERIIRERVPARQPIVVQQNVQKKVESESEDEELIEEIRVLKRKIVELQQVIANLKVQLDDSLNEKDDLQHNYEILLAKVKQLEDLLRSRNRELQDKVISLQNVKKEEDKIIVHVNQGKNKTSHVVKR
ncbi:unnamed protein product [Paramecium octaurelia]|uniref:Uncharacterized protein n=1 Tax=Paramecium octaurelia TaxID=43137 RepID=A0A8S1V2E1_PAROT|nr:unnamed protein product [Paramecium octaurelia]